jgi:ABC-type transport system involved in multi-copper enzyme maturation permease subunit
MKPTNVAPLRLVLERRAVGILYIEELKATMRGRFAWLGAAVVLLAVGGLAAVGTQDTWLDGYGIIAYFLVPLAFVPFAAGAIASPRANRFVESVFTAPVERRDWLAAKILVLLTVAAAYYVSLMPMMLVYVHHVGTPMLLRKFLLWTPALLLSSVAVGTLVGVLFIGRSIAAPAATGMGILLAYAGVVPLQELMVAQANGSSRTARLALASPAVLFKNALGFALVTTGIPATTTATWISAAVLIAGAFALAAYVFLRAQGVETWEATRRTRWTIALAIVALFLFPILFADRTYDATAPPNTSAPAIRALFARGSSSLGLVPPGGQLPARCCNTILNRDEWPMSTDTVTHDDLLVLLPVETSQHVEDLRVQVSGADGLDVAPDLDALRTAGEHLETRTYANDLGPAAADGHHVAVGWVARIPVAVDPTHPWDIGGDRYPIDVAATYRVAGDPQPRRLTARAAIDAQVGSAIYEMSAAGLLLPLFCLGAAITRWRRTR